MAMNKFILIFPELKCSRTFELFLEIEGVAVRKYLNGYKFNAEISKFKTLVFFFAEVVLQEHMKHVLIYHGFGFAERWQLIHVNWNRIWYFVYHICMSIQMPRLRYHEEAFWALNTKAFCYLRGFTCVETFF